MGIKVTLRQKKLKKGLMSLYLDFWPRIPHPSTGKLTRRQFLKMKVAKTPNNPFDKQHKKEMLKIGEQIRQIRENELNKPEIYTAFEKEQLRIDELGKGNFIEYFKKLANKRKGSNLSNWLSALKYLEAFTNGTLLFNNITPLGLEDFKQYLLTSTNKKTEKIQLSQNSASSYFNKVKAALKQAFKDGILQHDINAKIKPIKPSETQREYLTIEELKSLVKTHCNEPLLKKAAIFSALTGLRHSDISKLLWGEIEFIKDQGYFINFRVQKTESIEVLPIPNEAYELLGDAGEPKDLVFDGLKYSAYSNKHLAQWIGSAGITKKITFHCFRHTYATLQLSLGTDIYTVSKMLGHKDLKTTQIYAKVVDQAKRDTTNKIKLDL